MSNEIKTLLRKGILRDPEDSRDYQLSSISSGSSIPPSVDHSPYMSSVKYQGNLGACVAFSVVALKEWQEQKEYEEERKQGSSYKRDKTYNLSEQWLYWNCKKIDPWGNSVEGTNIRSAMKVLNKIGVPPEKAWTYTDDKINIGEPKSWANLISRWYRIGSYWRINNLDELKQALVDGPVVIGLKIFEDIIEPLKNGKVPLPERNRSLGGHALLAVGYNDETREIKVKNSWSKFWGERGYGYFSYEYIDRYMLDAWACRDIEVTRDMLKN